VEMATAGIAGAVAMTLDSGGLACTTTADMVSFQAGYIGTVRVSGGTTALAVSEQVVAYGLLSAVSWIEERRRTRGEGGSCWMQKRQK